jgi:hypothetical protein
MCPAPIVGRSEPACRPAPGRGPSGRRHAALQIAHPDPLVPPMPPAIGAIWPQGAYVRAVSPSLVFVIFSPPCRLAHRVNDHLPAGVDVHVLNVRTSPAPDALRRGMTPRCQWTTASKKMVLCCPRQVVITRQSILSRLPSKSGGNCILAARRRSLSFRPFSIGSMLSVSQLVPVKKRGQYAAAPSPNIARCPSRIRPVPTVPTRLGLKPHRRHCAGVIPRCN